MALFVCEKNFSCCAHKYWNTWEDVKQDAKECGHLVEVAEVKRGHWLEKDGEWYLYYCSVCDEGSDFRTRYCPNCGAKMDLEN